MIYSPPGLKPIENSTHFMTIHPGRKWIDISAGEAVRVVQEYSRLEATLAAHRSQVAKKGLTNLNQ